MNSASDALRAGAAARRQILLLALAPIACATADPARQSAPPTIAATSQSDTRIVLDHFDHLFAEATVDGERVGVLHIYSQAPAYRFAIEPNEGYACVDDVARGMVLLAATPQLDARRLRQLELMTRFVVQMQADNGYFHNFIWPDGRINRGYRTSLAELNWWSLRALWGLEAALGRLPKASAIAQRARAAADRVTANLVRDLPTGQTNSATADGITVPTWLPFGSGADAGATAMLGLLAHYKRTEDAAARALIGRLGDGLVRMQAGDARHFPYGAHLSWRNQWHAWGNLQAYALLRAGSALRRPDFTKSALAEVDGFYPYLLDDGMLSSFSLRDANGTVQTVGLTRYPQIAYGLSPMVLAAAEAYRVTGDARYRMLARRLAAWFTGSNAAHRPMYDAATGRVMDGLIAPREINANAGAESLIEGLFALQALNGAPLP